MRDRPPLLPALPLALSQLAVGWVAAVAVAVALVQAGPLGGVPAAYGYDALAAVHAAAGLCAWWRRPAHRLGPLLLLAAAAWLLGGLQNTVVPVLTAVGLLTSSLPLSAVVHLLHASPGGRLRGGLSRATVALGYVVGTVLQVPLWAFTPEPPPFDVLLVRPRPALASLGFHVQQSVGALVVLATTWVLARRLREYDDEQRRLLAPLFGLGLVAVLAIPVGGSLLRPVIGPERAVYVELVPLAGVPLGLLAVVLRGGFARTGELSALVRTATSPSASAAELQAAMARTLGDPTAVLLDPAAELPPARDGRAVLEVDVGGRPLGALVYDPQLNPDPAPVVAVGRVVAIALDHERLAQEVSASREALREASARLLEADDQQRRRIARDLHDGLQVSLVRLSIQAHQLAQGPVQPGSAAQLARDVDSAAADLRALVRGVVPALLLERGLAAALQELAYGMPLRVALDVDGVPARLPAPVESTAYFVVAEALTNVVKHAGAQSVSLRLRLAAGELSVEVDDDGSGGDLGGGPGRPGGGTGLPGLRDRIEVLGGSLVVSSDPDGTRLRAVLPCAS